MSLVDGKAVVDTLIGSVCEASAAEVEDVFKSVWGVVSKVIDSVELFTFFICEVDCVFSEVVGCFVVVISVWSVMDVLWGVAEVIVFMEAVDWVILVVEIWVPVETYSVVFIPAELVEVPVFSIAVGTAPVSLLVSLLMLVSVVVPSARCFVVTGMVIDVDWALAELKIDSGSSRSCIAVEFPKKHEKENCWNVS